MRLRSPSRSPDEVLFAHVACRPPGEIDLATAALLIGEVERPSVDIARYLGILDEWGATTRSRLGGTTAGSTLSVEVLGRLLFGELELRGNQDDYYDAGNSCLDQVIERRLGIPITLSIVYLEVARRAGLEAHGIGFPGHFLVRVSVGGGHIFLDPFHRGVMLDAAALSQRLAAVHPGVKLSTEHLAVLDNRQILTRVLNNLRGVYATNEDRERERRVVARLSLLASSDEGDEHLPPS
jgi:regulator of sirC expression with transglutaminase-like and TPR domain